MWSKIKTVSVTCVFRRHLCLSNLSVSTSKLSCPVFKVLALNVHPVPSPNPPPPQPQRSYVCAPFIQGCCLESLTRPWAAAETAPKLRQLAQTFTCVTPRTPASTLAALAVWFDCLA